VSKGCKNLCQQRGCTHINWNSPIGILVFFVGCLDTVMIKPLADKMADQTQKKGERMGIDQHPFGTLNNKVPRDPHKIPYLLLRNTFRSYNNLYDSAKMLVVFASQCVGGSKVPCACLYYILHVYTTYYMFILHTTCLYYILHVYTTYYMFILRTCNSSLQYNVILTSLCHLSCKV